jgi:hypothetical protein
MNQLIKRLTIWIALPLLIIGCDIKATSAPREVHAIPKETAYEDILGKSITDRFITDFLTSNHCSGANQFRLCVDVGLALWLDSNQVVETIYLYVNTSDGFEPYQGELPFGLKFYDTLGAVEYKLGRQGVGNSGLPDETGAPDHVHFWATYRQAGMTIIYNSPFADEDATIYAILLNA